MKKLGFNTRIWGWTLMTIFLTMMTWYVYKTQTDVLSRGHAMEILSTSGHVLTEGDYLIYTPDRDVTGFPTEVIQALEMMSMNYEVHIGSN